MRTRTSFIVAAFIATTAGHHATPAAVGACQRCYGKGGVGANNALALNGIKWTQLKTGSFDEIVAIITNGVPAEAIKDPSHTFAMRARGGPMNLTDPQIQAVAAYVYTLSHQ